MGDHLGGESLWSLHYDRKKHVYGKQNRVELVVAAPDLGTAISLANDRCGEDFRCMTGRHLGYRIVLVAPAAAPLACVAGGEK